MCRSGGSELAESFKIQPEVNGIYDILHHLWLFVELSRLLISVLVLVLRISAGFAQEKLIAMPAQPFLKARTEAGRRAGGLRLPQ